MIAGGKHKRDVSSHSQNEGFGSQRRPQKQTFAQQYEKYYSKVKDPGFKNNSSGMSGVMSGGYMGNDPPIACKF